MRQRVREFMIGGFLACLVLVLFFPIFHFKPEIYKSFVAFKLPVIPRITIKPFPTSKPATAPNITPKPVIPFPTRIPRITIRPLRTPTPTPTTYNPQPTTTPTPTETPTPTPTTYNPQPTTTPTPTLSPMVISYWKMDEGQGTSLSDSSGNGLDMELINTAWSNLLPPASNIDSYSVDLNGSGYGRLSNPILGDFFDFSTGFTVEAWINVPVTSSVTDSAIIGKWSENKGWGLGFSGTKALNIINGSKLMSGSNIRDGKWHHVGITWDGFQQKIYIDGNREGFISNTQIPQSNDRVLYMGSFNPPINIFSGLIDELKVYNYALNQTELQTDAGIIPPTPTNTPIPLPSPTPTITPTSIPLPVCGINECCSRSWCGTNSSGTGGIFCGPSDKCILNGSVWSCYYDPSC